MPPYRIINRRNFTSLKYRNVQMSDEAFEQLQETCRKLMVSQGSLLDSAVLYFLKQPELEILNILKDFKHLTDQELDYIIETVEGQGKKLSKPAKRRGKTPSEPGPPANAEP